MNRRQLRWLTAVGPVLFVAAVDLGLHFLPPLPAAPWLGEAFAFVVLACAAFLFSQLVFRHVGRVEQRMTERNHELSAARDELARQTVHLQALNDQVQSLAMIAERERIARELHDSLAQALGYVRMRATAGRDALARGDLVKVAATFADIGEVTREAYVDVREAILGLRTDVGIGRDLTGALAEYLERYQSQTGLPVTLQLGEGVTEARLTLGAETQLLRVIQEALANVRKHAGALGAQVQMTLTAETIIPRLRVTIADDGCGFDPGRVPKAAHYGLSTMRERIESVGGTFDVKSVPGYGTTVIGYFPLETAPTPPIEPNGLGSRSALDTASQVARSGWR
jgi:signal transduction histidine kinase